MSSLDKVLNEDLNADKKLSQADPQDQDNIIIRTTLTIVLFFPLLIIAGLALAIFVGGR